VKFAAACLAVLIWAAPASAQQPAPLFADTSPLQITIQGPLAEIASNRQNENGRPGTLLMGTEQLAIAIGPRGLNRRDPETCAFPPLRVDFVSPPPAASLFAGQRRLKLVTHCQRNESHQQHVLLEYAVYTMFNLLTPVSFRSRLARIDYRDPGGRQLTSRFGFFLEDIRDVASRNGMSRFPSADRIPISALSPREAALAALFEYMIGNLDWSMRAGPAGEGCCHNFRLLAKSGSSAAVPVPYDFDHSGLVNAPYATPPAELNVSSVRVRQYRGYCAHNAEALVAAQEIRAKQPQLLSVLTSVPGLSPQTANRASNYLHEFFRQIADDRAVQDRILKTCLR
jgi:hypothetical protein